jgi:sterol 3beta-glucosyltransferase
MGVFLQPVAPTGEFPPIFGTRSLGTTGNRLAGRVAGAVLEAIFADTNRAMRAQLGLPPVSSRTARRTRERQLWPIYHGFSPLVVPRPADWRPGLSVVGYWWPYYPPQPLPPLLAQFLDAGPPPAFVGLGSATVADPEQLSGVLVSALRAAGLRGVFQRGWAGLSAAGDDMLTIDEVPHAALLPHMAVVVHHAGAGTTAAGLRAGVPAVPVPLQLDAAFWSARLTALGVSPGAVPMRRLTAPALTAALVRATTDPSYRRRAGEVATCIRAEDSIAPVLSTVNRIAGACGAPAGQAASG